MRIALARIILYVQDVDRLAAFYRDAFGLSVCRCRHADPNGSLFGLDHVDEQDRRDLEVEAPPIYIQEKIDPRVLIENLRRTSTDGSPEPEMSLFDNFDGLGAMELVEFYQHGSRTRDRRLPLALSERRRTSIPTLRA